MYRRWINVSVIALTALLIAASGALAADNPVKTFQTTIKSADADSETVTLQVNSTHDITAFMRPGDAVEVIIPTGGAMRTFPATVKSADARPKTVTLHVDSIHDITAFMRPGEPAEVAVGGTAPKHPKGAL